MASTREIALEILASWPSKINEKSNNQSSISTYASYVKLQHFFRAKRAEQYAYAPSGDSAIAALSA